MRRRLLLLLPLIAALAGVAWWLWPAPEGPELPGEAHAAVTGPVFRRTGVELLDRPSAGSPHRGPEQALDPGITRPPDTGPAYASDELAQTLSVVVGTVWSGDDVLRDGVVMSEDCYLGSQVRDGEYEIVTTEPGWCTLVAVRMDGLLSTRSAPVEVEFVMGETTFVDIELPLERTGGLGVQIRPVGDGYQVVRVVPGAPAEDMGLRPGDVITEVDGLDAADLETDEFIATLTGPEGSDVEFMVSMPGDTGAAETHMLLTRQVLGESSGPARPVPASPPPPQEHPEDWDTGEWDTGD
jgi:hypothetical protein